MIKIRFLIFFLSLLPLVSFTQNVDRNLWVTGTANNIIKLGNKAYISGGFNLVGPYTGNLAVFDTNSIIPKTNFPKIDGAVNCVVSDGMGGFIVAGSFTKVDSFSIKNMIRIKPDLTIDTAWHPNPNSDVKTMVVKNNKLYVGGIFDNIGGQTRAKFAVLDLSTGKATSANFNPTNSIAVNINCIILVGNTVYVGGRFSTMLGTIRNNMAAIDVLTDNLKPWNPNLSAEPYCMVNEKGKIYFGGNFTTVGGQARNKAAAVDTLTGALLPWNPNVDSYVNGMTIVGSKLYLGGNFTNAGGQARSKIAAVDTVTGAVTSWQGNVLQATNDVTKIEKLGNDKVIILGQYNSAYPPSVMDTLGNLSNWNPHFSSTPHFVYCYQNLVLFCTSSNVYNLAGIKRKNIAEMDLTTGKATSWDLNPEKNAEKMLIGNVGDTLFFASSDSVVGNLKYHISAVSASTHAQLNFATTISYVGTVFIRTFAVYGNKIFIGGLFDNVGGVTRKNLAAINLADGQTDSFNFPTGSDVYSILIDKNIMYLATNINAGGITRKALASYDLISNRITPWNPLKDCVLPSVRAMEIVNNVLYVGGSGTWVINSKNRRGAAAFDLSNMQMTDWNPNVNSTIYSIKANGNLLLVGGTFSTIGGQSRSGVALLDSKYGLATAWNPQITWSSVSAFIFKTGGEIFVSGAFTSFIKPGIYGVARLAGLAYNANYISGTSFTDLNNNCMYEAGETVFNDRVIKVNGEDFFVKTDANGNYRIAVDTGNYTIEQIIPAYKAVLYPPTCPSGNAYKVSFTTYGNESFNNNFANNILSCSLTTVVVQSTRRRVCTGSATIISYANEGTAIASNVGLRVKYPSYIKPETSSIPWISNYGDSVLVFSLGNLAPGQSGNIKIKDFVRCMSEILGLTQCVEVEIGPLNICTGLNSGWDLSDVNIQGSCGVTKANFTIKNIGTGNMSDSTFFRTFYGDTLVYVKKFKLPAGDSLIVEVPFTTKTIRLEADQTAGHPLMAYSKFTLEGCGFSETLVEKNYIRDFPSGFTNVQIAESCMPLLHSFDPNEKEVLPEGFTSEHYVKPNTDLEYTIHFQNTGNDTAYIVIIKDTLSSFVDLSGFRNLVASHDYEWNISGSGLPVLTWTFKNINLLPASKDSLKSQGFIKYSISQKQDNANGTLIKNKANIYFDYNLPIITNETSNQIMDQNLINLSNGNNILVFQGLNTGIVKNNSFAQVSIYPNPARRDVTISCIGNSNKLNISIMSIDGRVLSEHEISAIENSIDLSNLQNGCYFIQIKNSDGEMYYAKLIKE